MSTPQARFGLARSIRPVWSNGAYSDDPAEVTHCCTIAENETDRDAVPWDDAVGTCPDARGLSSSRADGHSQLAPPSAVERSTSVGRCTRSAQAQPWADQWSSHRRKEGIHGAVSSSRATQDPSHPPGSSCRSWQEAYRAARSTESYSPGPNSRVGNCGELPATWLVTDLVTWQRLISYHHRQRLAVPPGGHLHTSADRRYGHNLVLHAARRAEVSTTLTKRGCSTLGTATSQELP